MKPSSLLPALGRLLAALLSLLALLAVPAPVSAGSLPAVPISFTLEKLGMSQGAVSVDLILNRTDASVSATVTLNTDDGTALVVPPFKPALAGVDYVDLTGPATTVSFEVGEFYKAVTVTLIPKTGTAVPNKRFTATLSNPSAGSSLGAIPTTKIEILATDMTNPTLTITAPSATTTTVSAPLPYVLKGMAGDMRGVDFVEVTLNTMPLGRATLGAATSPTSVPYSLPLPLSPGPNTVNVTAYDLRGNSTTVSRSFTFTQRYNVSLARNPPPGVTPDTAGTVGLTAMPTGSASSLSPSTPNASPKTASVVPGSTVKISAMPKAGYTFSHWTGLPYPYTYAGNYVTFTMPANDVPGITAHFVANPFQPAPGQGNTFYGTLSAPFPLASGSGEGFVTGSLTPSFGLFSGKVIYNGVTKSFASYFFGNGSCLFNVGTSKLPYLSLGGGVSLSLHYIVGAGFISAEILDDASLGMGGIGGIGGGFITEQEEGGGGISPGGGSISPSIIIPGGGGPLSPDSVALLQRASHSAANPVTAGLLNFKQPATAAGNNRGYFTFALPPLGFGFTADPALYPQGFGFGNLTLSTDGALMFAGTLADGTSFTGASGLIAGDAAPIFAPLTVPGASASAPKLGSLSGFLMFTTSFPDAHIIAPGALRWIRPAVTPVSSPAAAAAATNLYTDGWPAGIFVNVIGTLYDKTSTVQANLLLPAATPGGNAALLFRSGKLTEDILKTNFNITGNTVAKIPTMDSSFTLAVTAAGTFSGNFTPNWSPLATTKPMYKGVLLQKGVNRGGLGYFHSNIKNDLDPESGIVSLNITLP